MTKLLIDIWSDLGCPWCYVAKRRLEQALERFPHRSNVEVVWHAFELDPSLPRVVDLPHGFAAMVAQKYGTQRAQAQAMIDEMVDRAAQDGLELRYDRIRPGNTFDAHRLLSHARGRGTQGALKERMMSAYMTEGQAIGDHDVLVKLAREAGLDEQEARDVLDSDRCAAEVRQDKARARELGVTSVPFFMLAGRLKVSGTQSVEVMLGALERAWAEIYKPELETFAEGAACSADGCD